MTDRIRPEHFKRRDYTKEVIYHQKTSVNKLDNIQPKTEIHEHKKHESAGSKIKKIILIAGLLLLAVALFIGLNSHRSSSPVPKNIQKAASYPIYYPDPKKLPAGYSLDTKSFTNPVKNGVNYSVNYANGKKLVFSLQPKISDNELQGFYGSYIPLKIDIHSNLGQAELGTYQGKTIVSLAINDGPWIIITAPPDIDQNQLRQILQTLHK